ncbi:MAG: hypothetical protein SGPRY_011726, partial [Prymnesium sp.]
AAAAKSDLENAVGLVKEVEAEQAEWEAANPIEAAGKASVKAGGAIAEVAANALLTSLFGESKAAREEREAREAQEREARVSQEQEARSKPSASPSEEDGVQEEGQKGERGEERGEEPDEERRVAPEAEASEEGEVGEEEEKGLEEEEKEPVDIDAELRRKREEAEEILRQRRPRPLSSTVATNTLDAALAAASEFGAVASWASERREALRIETELQEKFNRLSLFEADLNLLGIELNEETVAELDEKKLRKAWKDRSRVLHPDVRAQRLAEETEGVPSVYELNAAREGSNLLCPSRCNAPS